MFYAPIDMMMPNKILPAFNDGSSTPMRDGLYEIGYSLFNDPLLASILDPERNSYESLLFGQELLPVDNSLPRQSSVLMADSGFGILRAQSEQGDERYIAIDFGEHGGPHGHYDKLSLVSYANGQQQSIDPEYSSKHYRTDVHSYWSKQTIAHNTVVVNKQSQQPSTGRVLNYSSFPFLSYIDTSADSANDDANMSRFVLLTGDYWISHFFLNSSNNSAQTYDWIHHQVGELKENYNDSVCTPWSYNSAKEANGYFFLTDLKCVDNTNAMNVSFEHSNSLLNHVWQSPYLPDNAQVNFSTDDNNVPSGSNATQLSYNFPDNKGYLVAGLLINSLRDEMPKSLELWVKGDNSENELKIRLYDAYNERFLANAGIINWSGWKKIKINSSLWTSQANNSIEDAAGKNGIMEFPIRSAGIQIRYSSRSSGAISVDELIVHYNDGKSRVVQSFDDRLIGTRVTANGFDGATLIMGNGVNDDDDNANTADIDVPFALLRVEAKDAHFISVHEAYNETVIAKQWHWTSLRKDDTVLAGELSNNSDNLTDVVFYQNNNMPIAYTVGLLNTNAQFNFLRFDNDQLLKINTQTASHIAWDSRVLLHSSASLSAEINYSADGTTVDIHLTNTQSNNSQQALPDAAISLWGPLVTQVVMGDAVIPFIKNNNTITLFSCAQRCITLEGDSNQANEMIYLYDVTNHLTPKLLATTYSDEQGHYIFSGIDPSINTQITIGNQRVSLPMSAIMFLLL